MVTQRAATSGQPAAVQRETTLPRAVALPANPRVYIQWPIHFHTCLRPIQSYPVLHLAIRRARLVYESIMSACVIWTMSIHVKSRETAQSLSLVSNNETRSIDKETKNDRDS